MHGSEQHGLQSHEDSTWVDDGRVTGTITFFLGIEWVGIDSGDVLLSEGFILRLSIIDWLNLSDFLSELI